MKMTSALLSVLVCVGFVSMASGAMSITNGDFEADNPGSNADVPDVTDWYESDVANFWESPWCKIGGGSHNGTGILLLSGDAGAAGAAIDGAGLVGFVYQNIGTADGASEVIIAFEMGLPLDGPQTSPGRDLGITFTILESAGSFVPGEDLDVLGGAGMTVIDQQTKFYPGVIVGDLALEQWTFDLSSAGAGDLFLRINNYTGAIDIPYVDIDNVAIVPEPATMSLLAIDGLALIRRRKRA